MSKTEKRIDELNLEISKYENALDDMRRELDVLLRAQEGPHTTELLAFIIEHGHFQCCRGRIEKVYWDDDSKRKECLDRWDHPKGPPGFWMDGRRFYVAFLDGQVEVYFYDSTGDRLESNALINRCVELGVDLRFIKEINHHIFQINQSRGWLEDLKQDEFKLLLRKEKTTLIPWLNRQIQELHTRGIPASGLVIPVWMDKLIQQECKNKLAETAPQSDKVAKVELKKLWDKQKKDPFYYEPLAHLLGLPVISTVFGEFRIDHDKMYGSVLN